MSGEQGGADLQRFRAAVLSDAALQAELGALEDDGAFIPRVLAVAEARGLHLDAEELRRAARGDPLGLDRFSAAPPGDVVPRSGWLPINVLLAAGQLCVDWAWFGEHALSEPFFEDSIRKAMFRPLNRIARYRTRLIDIGKSVAQEDVLEPSGFIFHMSRCGSTLVAQMLAADPRNVVVSEAAPLDAVVRANPGTAPNAGQVHAGVLAAMVRALGHRRAPQQARLFVKLDSWHTLALPLLRRAFPSVPWVFLYREPGAVLASQKVQRGIQTVPEYLPPALFGLSEADALDSDAYCARVLARTCEAILAPLAEGGLVVNYNELPDALFTAILPHFGIEPSTADRARMREAAKFDAKTPNMTFAGDDETKRKTLTDELRAVADRHIGDVYRQLEARRLSQRERRHLFK